MKRLVIYSIVPMVSELFLGLGCSGEDNAQRDACWAARTWELTIDEAVSLQPGIYELIVNFSVAM